MSLTLTIEQLQKDNEAAPQPALHFAFEGDVQRAKVARQAIAPLLDEETREDFFNNIERGIEAVNHHEPIPTIEVDVPLSKAHDVADRCETRWRHLFSPKGEAHINPATMDMSPADIALAAHGLHDEIERFLATQSA